MAWRRAASDRSTNFAASIPWRFERTDPKMTTKFMMVVCEDSSLPPYIPAYPPVPPVAPKRTLAREGRERVRAAATRASPP